LSFLRSFALEDLPIAT